MSKVHTIIRITLFILISHAFELRRLKRIKLHSVLTANPFIGSTVRLLARGH